MVDRLPDQQAQEASVPRTQLQGTGECVDHLLGGRSLLFPFEAVDVGVVDVAQLAELAQAQIAGFRNFLSALGMEYPSFRDSIFPKVALPLSVPDP